MPEMPWGEMSVDEKLEWLRAETQRLIGVGNFNMNSLNERERTINQRLGALEETENDIAGCCFMWYQGITAAATAGVRHFGGRGGGIDGRSR
jgi:hypothetical protein